MSRKILGLDIRRNSISAAQIQGTLQGYVIEKLIHIDVDEGQEEDLSELGDSLKDNTAPADIRGEQLLTMLEKLSNSIDFSSADCFVSFPSIDMSFRNLTVPFKNKKKIGQVLPFELEPVIPGSVDDLTMDFILPDQESDEEETQVVAAAVRTGLLESFDSCLKKGGLSVQAIVPGGSAMAEYLIAMSDLNNDYLFLDTDNISATLFLIRDNTIASIRSFITNNPKGTGLEVTRTLLAYCEQNDIRYQPDLLYVTGPACMNPDFVSILTDTTGLVVESIDVVESMGFTKEDAISGQVVTEHFQNALALCHSGIYGIKGLRLNERHVALGKYLSEYRDQLIPTGIILLLVIIVFFTGTIYDIVSLNKTIASYDRQMTTIYKEAFPEATKIIDPYTQMKANLIEEKKKSDFVESSAGDVRIIDLLNDISKNLPVTMDIEFDRFVLGNDDLKISGKTDSYKTVDDMKGRLEKIDYLKSVVITSTAGGKSDNEVNFKLKIDF